MTYARAPGWLAATRPAWVTAGIFHRCNADSPRAARYAAALPCFLTGGPPEPDPGCVHELRPGDRVWGPPRMNLASNLASGRHAFRFELGESPGCAIGEVRLEVITRGDRGRLLAVQTIRVGPGQAVSLPFRLRLLDAAFGTVAVAAEGLTGCAVLEDVRWSEAAARPVWGPPRRLVGGSAAP